MTEIESDPNPIFVASNTHSSTPLERQRYYHLRLLADEAMLEETGKYGGSFRMTSKGHDFVAAVRDDTIWRKTKDAAGQVAGASLSMLGDIAIGYLRQKLIGLGVPL